MVRSTDQDSIASSQLELDTSSTEPVIGANNKGRRVVDYDEDDFFAGGGQWRRPNYDVFINHRGLDDTKRTVARLLYDRLNELSGGRVPSFLDSMCMRPGDHLHSWSRATSAPSASAASRWSSSPSTIARPPRARHAR
ncbi:hypothetical protein PR202_ga29303 [Eleusine coracana subsp. coracana]|uniref:TIR domain-containing protein n=1 Tax=Eleusine coracana subsp. coracana TaxID=191504 RepID=A0AAV5DLA2_ELECO|nr:hypothetical protein PR202_ga29303 [Eleusine coracana subsp. coracana]